MHAFCLYIYVFTTAPTSIVSPSHAMVARVVLCLVLWVARANIVYTQDVILPLSVLCTADVDYIPPEENRKLR